MQVFNKFILFNISENFADELRNINNVIPVKKSKIIS